MNMTRFLYVYTKSKTEKEKSKETYNTDITIHTTNTKRI